MEFTCTRKAGAIILAMLMLFSSVATLSCYAEELREGGLPTDGSFYYYHYSGDSGYTAAHYRGSSADIVVPDEFDGVPVTGISGALFDRFEADGALPAVRSVTIPKHVADLSLNQAAGVLDLLPQSVEAFYVSGKNQSFSSMDGVLYAKEKTSLLCYPPAKKESRFVLPAETEDIRGIIHTEILVIPSNSILTTLPIASMRVAGFEIEAGNQNFASYDGAVYSKNFAKLLFLQ